MGSKGFSLGEVIRFGCNKFKENWLFLVGYFFITGIISSVGYFFEISLQEKFPSWQFLFQIAFGLLNMMFSLGLMKACLEIVDGGKPSWSCIYSGFPLLLKYLFGVIFYGIIVFIGLILFIIPGVVWGFKYILFPYAIVDKRLGPLSALDESAKVTDGARWDIFGWGLTSIVFFYASTMILVGVPLGLAMYIFNLPQQALFTTHIGFGISLFSIFGIFVVLFSLVVSLVMAYIYRKLERASRNVEAV